MPLTFRLHALRRKAAAQDVDHIDAILLQLEQEFLTAPPPPGHAAETRHARQLEWRGIVTQIDEKLVADDEKTDRAFGVDGQAKTTARKTDTKSPPADTTEKHKDAQVIRVADHAITRDRFILGDNGEPLAVPRNGSPIARSLNSREYRADLLRSYRQATGQVANASALDSALHLLYADALHADDENVYLRLARLADRVIIDRAAKNSGDVIEITAEGIRLLEISPVIFRRTKLLAELAKPGEPNLDALREFVNLDEPNFRLFIGWLCGALLDVPIPILVPEGEPGTGKTTFARITRQLVDPSPVEMISPPREPKAWRVTATNQRVILLDNVNHLPRWLADSLTRAVTGDGDSDRTLYTDNEPSVYRFRRAIVITSVRFDYSTAEIAQRLLLLPLERISDGHRRTETELHRQLSAKLPEIVGGLFGLVSQIIDTVDNIETPGLPRMADFGKVLAAVDDVMGWQTFRTYRQRVTDTVADAGSTDEFLDAIVAAMKNEMLPNTYRATDILNLAKRHTDNPNSLPGNARAAGVRLSQSTEALASRGLRVGNLARTGASRSRWEFARTDDANDANDAKLPTSYLFPK